MIDYKCHECREKMEITDRMAGRRVPCVQCGARVLVPEDLEYRREPRRRPEDPGLSRQEFALYTALFLFVPFVIVILSSVLYYVWKEDTPNRANQINRLGFATFGFHMVVGIALIVLLK